MSVDALAQPATSETTTARAGLVLALIVTCQLMIVLDATVVNVALPPIQQDLGFSATGLSWVVNAYTLAFGGLLLFGGRLGDVFGRRRVFGAGVTLFTLASLVGGAAPNDTRDGAVGSPARTAACSPSCSFRLGVIRQSFRRMRPCPTLKRAFWT